MLEAAANFGRPTSNYQHKAHLSEACRDIKTLADGLVNALLDKDYNIIMGFLVIGVMIRLLGNLISDLTYALIDPRIRFK